MNIQRTLFGFFYTLVSGAATILLYLAFSPVFSVILPALRPSSDIIFFSPFLQNLMDYIFVDGWVYVLFWIVLDAILLWFGQIFRKEQQREEYYA